MYCVVTSIKDAHWVPQSDWLFLSPIPGLLIGLLVAKIRGVFQGVLHVGACVVGYWLALFLTSSVVYHIPVLELLTGLRSVLTGSMASLPQSLAEALFFFYLSFLNFFLSYFGCWLVYRARLPWLVVLIYCAILLVNLNYVKSDSAYLVCLMVGALLLLVARVYLAAQITQWMRDGLHTDRTWRRTLAWRCMQVTCLFTLCTLCVSWFLPFARQTENGRVFWDYLDNGWNNAISGRFSWNNPASLFNGSAANFFDNKLTITGSVTLPSGEVLTYTSSNKQPQYLEGFTFNMFDGRTWTTSIDQAGAEYFDAKAPLSPDTPQAENAGEQIETNVTILQPPGGPRSYIFAPAQPIRFDVPVYVSYDATANTWLQQHALTKGETYTVRSLLPTQSIGLLQSVPLPRDNGNDGVWEADSNYPIIQGAYTDVAEGFSPHVKEQALQWIGDATDAYTALKRLEMHLSDQGQFTYSVYNAPIPNDTNVVDWLLSQKRGYCTYYASAMVVMARMLHIPTRMTNGFSSGHYDEQRKQWIVDGQDAHSWVQAYFPNIGWVNFDPTPGFTTPASGKPRPGSTPTAEPTATQPTSTPTPKSTQVSHTQVTPPTDHNQPGIGQGGKGVSDGLLLGTSLTVLLIAILVFGVALMTYWWRGLYATSTFIAGAYWRLCLLASKLGFEPKPWQTPFEYSHMLGQHAPSRFKPLWHLTELFVRDRWGPHHPDGQVSQVNNVKQVQPALRGILWKLLLSRWSRK
ncbi:hypothetical protein KSX_29400 [Ktedonospora formicarum]|uniref:Transglutaminase-like domain-containing protein n=2 Tax=Ktedonospora formicarum TaxID=2778364 RepID=A0A8J3HVF4_9CHLR|nr:hypothetical protein KSX_29400 [Ktedonospora formicarum]